MDRLRGHVEVRLHPLAAVARERRRSPQPHSHRTQERPSCLSLTKTGQATSGDSTYSSDAICSPGPGESTAILITQSSPAEA
eukprot:4071716-Prymnesium_polylepis.1